MTTTSCGDRRGSEAGYKRHRRAHEPACEHCLIGHRNYVARWYARTVGYRSHKLYSAAKAAS